MPDIRIRSHDLHLRVVAEGLSLAHAPMNQALQANLAADVRNLMAEYFHYLKAPSLPKDVMATAIVEIVSEDTIQYIKQLEKLLREAAHEQGLPDTLTDRIYEALR